jgi:hypothetical protein
MFSYRSATETTYHQFKGLAICRMLCQLCNGEKLLQISSVNLSLLPNASFLEIELMVISSTARLQSQASLLKDKDRAFMVKTVAVPRIPQ